MGVEMMKMKKRMWICTMIPLLFVFCLSSLTLGQEVASEVDNHLTVYVDGWDDLMGGYPSDEYKRYVSAGDSVPMTVIASADDENGITYQWYRSEYDVNTDSWTEYEQIEEAAESSYTLENISCMTICRCDVRDQFGNSKSVWFHVYIENHLTAYVEGQDFARDSQEIYVSLGESVVMAVDVLADDESGITYQWEYQKYDTETGSWINPQPIEGATESSYSLENTSGRASYYCIVTDKYGNRDQVSFSICIENNLAAYVQGSDYNTGTYCTMYFSPGDTVTMSVVATADDGIGITYQWYYYENGPFTGYAPTEYRVKGAAEATYVLENASRGATYICYVHDKYENIAVVHFYLCQENHLTAYVDGLDYASQNHDMYVSPGESVTMSVIASADDESGISYQWYYSVYDLEQGTYTTAQKIEGATGSSYTFEDLNGLVQCRCEVNDQYGNYEQVWFYLHPENHLTAYVDGLDYDTDWYEVYVSPGENATLAVKASAEDESGITYQWSCDEYDPETHSWKENRRIKGATESSYIVENVSNAARYFCDVRDKYGNSCYVDFRVYPENHLTAYVDGLDYNTNSYDIYVSPRESLTLGVIASADDEMGIIYQWYYEESDPVTGSWIRDGIIEGATGPTYSLTIENMSNRVCYRCSVHDRYGNYADVLFYPHLENHLTAYVDGLDCTKPLARRLVLLSDFFPLLHKKVAVFVYWVYCLSTPTYTITIHKNCYLCILYHVFGTSTITSFLFQDLLL